MRGRTITIDGRRYDATTGVPVDAVRSSHVPKRSSRRTVDGVVRQRPAATTTEAPAPAEKKRHHTPAHNVHSKAQRSQTLHRAALKKPTAKHASETKRQRAVVPKSPHISKFAPRKQEAEQSKKQSKAPASHNVATKIVNTKKPSAHHATPISSRSIKEKLIQDQLDKADTSRQYTDHKAPKKLRRGTRFASFSTAALALILLGGYLTYLNMPNLSIRVAAAQAGVDASMPGYHPDGYRFNGPITFANGQVTLQYKTNGGPHGYSLVQKESDWDSQAVLDNYVLDASGGKYNIHSTQGLTVYTFDSKAVWVNRGILHEVDYSDAPLSYNQIEQIAASM